MLKSFVKSKDGLVTNADNSFSNRKNNKLSKDILVNTWTKSSKYSEDMRERGTQMLTMANKFCEWKSVVDVGCGNQQLKAVIKDMNPESKYIGIDLLDHCVDTLIADFNKGEFPKVSADLAILSGVVEHVYPEMINTFIDHVCASSPVIVVSYWPIDYDKRFVWATKGKKKRPEIWVNHYKLGDIVTLFAARQFQLEMLERYNETSQYLLLFKAHH